MTSKTSQKKPARKLSNFLCFAVYSANLAFGRAYKPILDKIGLTYTQYIALVALWEEDDQTVSSLGEKLFLESNTLTPILKKLEVMGFVTRRRAAADERQVVVSLTDKGKQLGEVGIGNNLVPATRLAPDEFATLQQSVVALRDNLIESTKAR
ncbi:MarR family winged helix-turn-helix transcriptional regulator [Roseiterribacter gracilis]|uniref:Transcriptional regulator n=1 Tax=Roseiterribacter gracilis TaxID=2812848 RepID=A0A8S8XKB0_9PROT|nr:transcriptional regulator [Rhodospirillales bacterium TMPK1]